jgi:hypothetical protein
MIHSGASTTAKDVGSGTPYVNLTSGSNTESPSPASANIWGIVGGAVGGAVVFIAALYALWRKMQTMRKMREVKPSPAWRAVACPNLGWSFEAPHSSPPARYCTSKLKMESALDVGRKS